MTRNVRLAAIHAFARFVAAQHAVVDLETKRAALAKAGPIGDIDPALAAWRSDASILAWLEAL